MRLLCTTPEIALFLLCSLRAVFNAKDWSNYSTCAAPIQIFLVAAPLTLMAMILTFSFFRAYVRVNRIRKYLDALIILILTPFCCYLIIQGIIWQFIIYSKPRNILNCPAGDFPTYWIWISLLFVIEIRFAKVSYIMTRAYWRAYQMRRTIRNLRQSADNGDYERFKKAFHRTQNKRKYIDIFIICILTPLSFYLSIQGGFWQMKIYSETPECPAKYFPLFWIILLFGFGVHFIEISYFILKTYWRAYQIRRTIENMNQFAADGDYQRFNQTILELGEIYNENIGLLPSDIERLEKKFYQQALQGENNIENCPICLVEFNAEDKVMTLPRCEHTFHSECVATWLQKKPLCPMCRGNIRSSMLDFESQTEENKNYYRPPSAVAANTQ